MQIHICLWTVVLTVTVVLGGYATAEPTQKGIAIQAHADAGDADAQYEMSLTYLHKYEGLRVSDEKRAEYVQKAVSQGHLEAKERLASFDKTLREKRLPPSNGSSDYGNRRDSDPIGT